MSPSRAEKEKAASHAQVFAVLGFVAALTFFLFAIGLYVLNYFFWGIVFAFLALFCGNSAFKNLTEHSEIKKTLDNFTLSPPCLLTIGDAIITYKYRISSDIDPDDSPGLFPSRTDTDAAIVKIWNADPTAPLEKFEEILKIKVMDIHRKPAPPPPPSVEPKPRKGFYG